ncbi:hypothetical protein I4I73_04965 [Pseudonocardia sp. KRD-184]|uniref:hypothetical protein n=1 Tax=Pseudonocardia oceani TaxID=2792013 RepID=UPI001C4A2A2E|nr:hypothetical protein [Pseudonocardia oceani]MBW0090527.1 hypothetical protein [Pseudonocardia oceani]MBW0095350.1 hypothetical protein [Pseudonocardia oceani]MBW0108120.1 hypothetical protein [Pseudonocardia oceani]MBW0120072.1 hypothetical protein [Pseudonocardia oceani]
MDPIALVRELSPSRGCPGDDVGLAPHLAHRKDCDGHGEVSMTDQLLDPLTTDSEHVLKLLGAGEVLHHTAQPISLALVT